jgi:hypothetical protein
VNIRDIHCAVRLAIADPGCNAIAFHYVRRSKVLLTDDGDFHDGSSSGKDMA